MTTISSDRSNITQFFEQAKTLPEGDVIALAKSRFSDLFAPGTAIKIKKASPLSTIQEDRSTVLTRSLVFLPNGIIFCTGKSSTAANCDERNSIPGGSDASFLGAGASKVVWRVENLGAGRPMAIGVPKKFKASRVAQESKAFENEYRLTQQITSEYILKADSWGKRTTTKNIETAYIAYELCSCTLGDYLNTHHNLLPKKLFAQIEEGLGSLHKKKIFHKDLHENNIYLNSQGDIRISDFGFSIQGDEAALWQRSDLDCLSRYFLSCLAHELFESKGLHTARESVSMLASSTLYNTSFNPGEERLSYFLYALDKYPELTTEQELVATIVMDFFKPIIGAGYLAAACLALANPHHNPDPAKNEDLQIFPTIFTHPNAAKIPINGNNGLRAIFASAIKQKNFQALEAILSHPRVKELCIDEWSQNFLEPAIRSGNDEVIRLISEQEKIKELAQANCNTLSVLSQIASDDFLAQIDFGHIHVSN